ncbi:MAG TPA: flagellar protein FlgN [Planctomycetota bacterium]|nr:flagellar protein FlgN [Planctomycetota bacterium]
MIEVLKALEESLSEEIRLERTLLGVGTRKRDALVSLDLREVEQATSQEHNLLVALGGSAERRMRRTSDAARLLGLPDAEASVTRVAQRAGEPWSARLLAQAGELRDTLRSVSRVNAANSQLAQQSIGHVQRFFLVLSGQKDEVTYTRRGTGRRPEIRKIMIDQVI